MRRERGGGEVKGSGAWWDTRTANCEAQRGADPGATSTTTTGGGQAHH